MKRTRDSKPRPLELRSVKIESDAKAALDRYCYVTGMKQYVVVGVAIRQYVKGTA